MSYFKNMRVLVIAMLLSALLTVALSIAIGPSSAYAGTGEKKAEVIEETVTLSTAYTDAVVEIEDSPVPQVHLSSGALYVVVGIFVVWLVVFGVHITVQQKRMLTENW